MSDRFDMREYELLLEAAQEGGYAFRHFGGASPEPDDLLLRHDPARPGASGTLVDAIALNIPAQSDQSFKFDLPDAGAAELDVVKEIDRCVMVTRSQPNGIERDLDVLRTIVKERAGNLGVGALITRSGAVAVGDVLLAV